MTCTFKAIDHIQLAAPKGAEDAARNFFGDLLGFTELDKPEPLRSRGGVWFQNGSIQLHIGIEEPFTPSRKAHPAFEVENIDALMRHLKANSVKIVEDGHLPGAKRFYVNDPFGNRIEMLEWQ